ncbi:MAG: tyrosine-type recombinase/integrase [Lachnospiraceae bacterium]|nr:tyrosine-type recombinase/integrase [Lachnospiraceae bacterium]
MDPKNMNYHESIKASNILKLRELQAKLPAFTKDYFIGRNDTISSRTKIAYAYDLIVFFEYIHDNTDDRFSGTPITSYKVDVLDEITRNDILYYMEYLSYYEKDGKVYTNDERGKARKLASLKSFYQYYFVNEIIKTNPAALVPMPKLHEKEIIRLDINEVVDLLDLVENGAKLTKGEKRFFDKNATRDFTILTVMLGTGIRVSECVGLNISDVDLEDFRFKVRRKGGKEGIIYFGDEVCDALANYLELRNSIIALEGHEDALFLSMQNKRMSVRAMENMVGKYTSKLSTLKHITPHKLRSTFGTNLYRETNDIYLVADFLGHKDVNTTRKHYASISDDTRRNAIRNFKLRENDDDENNKS